MVFLSAAGQVLAIALCVYIAGGLFLALCRVRAYRLLARHNRKETKAFKRFSIPTIRDWPAAGRHSISNGVGAPPQMSRPVAGNDALKRRGRLDPSENNPRL